MDCLPQTCGRVYRDRWRDGTVHIITVIDPKRLGADTNVEAMAMQSPLARRRNQYQCKQRENNILTETT